MIEKSGIILLAGGQSTRMEGIDKILYEVNGIPVFLYSLKIFLLLKLAVNVTIVYKDERQKEFIKRLIDKYIGKITSPEILWAKCGNERMYSVWNGLRVMTSDIQWVWIHDCARPLITYKNLVDLGNAVKLTGGAVLVHPIFDTIRQISYEKNDEFPEKSANEISKKYNFDELRENHQQNVSLKTIDRTTLVAMETPQVFSYFEFYNAYKQIIIKNEIITDDVSAWEQSGKTFYMVKNDTHNFKITTNKDLELISCILKDRNISNNHEMFF